MNDTTYNTGGVLDGLGFRPSDEDVESKFIEDVERLTGEYLATYDDGPEQETGRGRARQQIQPFINWLKERAGLDE